MRAVSVVCWWISVVGFFLMFILWFIGLKAAGIVTWVIWHVAYWIHDKTAIAGPAKRQPGRSLTPS